MPPEEIWYIIYYKGSEKCWRALEDKALALSRALELMAAYDVRFVLSTFGAVIEADEIRATALKGESD